MRRQRRRGWSDIDDEYALDADAEYALAEADYQRWLAKRWSSEGYDEPDPAFDPSDPDDNERLVGVWERGRLP